MTSSPFFPVPGLGPALDLVDELGFTVEVIEELKSFLAASSDELGVLPEQVREVGDAAFGANPPGAELALHTGKARAVVVEAVLEMATGLEEYRAAVQQMEIRATEADEAARADLESTLARAESHFRGPQGKGGGR